MAAGVTVQPRYAKPVEQARVITITADKTLRASENGALVVFNSSSSLIVTLPAAQKGLSYEVFVKTVPGSGVGPLIKVHGSTAKIYSKVSATGATISESAGKGVVNTQATSVKGDSVRVTSDGTDWFVTDIAGTWAREA